MRNKMFLPILFFLSAILIVDYTCAAESPGDKIKLKAVTHLNSNVTSGKLSPETLVMSAVKKGIHAVFITENFYPKLEYGVLPFRGIVKKVEEFNSLLKFGPEKYYKRIEAIDKKLENIDVFMSAEVVPAYFWTGDPYKKGLTLNDWDIQFLVFGLKPGEYRHMPTLSNGKFSKFNFITFLKLWPVFLFILGVVLIRVKFYRFYINNAIPWLMVLVGAFYSLHLFPFKHVMYDQYHGRVLPGPYQELIDYVNDKGGMVFWSAPEAQLYRRYGPILFASPKATEHMLSTRDYTGFCALYEGYRDIGGAGGIWDVILNEYCWGKRDNPVWIIGESAFHDKKSSGGKEIDDVQTVFFAEEKSKKGILDAMRDGSMYIVRKGKGFTLELDDFFLRAPDGEKAFMGETLETSGPVTVFFRVKWDAPEGKEITAELIRGGKVIKKFLLRGPGMVEFADDYYSPEGKIYYRLDIRGKYPGMLFTNPVFVTFTGKDED